MMAVIFGFAFSSAAQEGRKGEKPNAEQMTERMKTQLNLTEDQYKSVYAANEEMIKMIVEAGGKEADRETKEKIRKHHLGKLNEILTPDQMGKMKEGRKARGLKGRPNRVEKPEE